LTAAIARAKARVAAAAEEHSRRAALERSLAARFWLRFHMSVMLGAAFGAGFMVSDLLLRAGVGSAPIRWPVGVIAGYLALFFCMRLWLAYIGVRPLWRGVRRARGGADPLDAVGSSDGGGWSGGGGPGGVFRGGGGVSGGGGASGSFGDAMPRLAAVGGSSSKSSSGGGFDLGDGDFGALLILIVIVLALTAALGGGVVFLVATAPHLLADVAFGAALTGGIAPAARRVANADEGWSGSVWTATRKPFVIIMIVVVLAALAFAHYFPAARTLGEAFRAL